MHRVLEALSEAGCDVAYGLKMHVGQEEYYLKDLRQFAYDTTIQKLENALCTCNSEMCYFYSKALLPVYAGLGFMSALYISDSIAEAARCGTVAGLSPLFAELDKVHKLYTEIIKTY